MSAAVGTKKAARRGAAGAAVAASEAPNVADLLRACEATWEAKDLLELVTWINQARLTIDRLNYASEQDKDLCERLMRFDVHSPNDAFDEIASSGLDQLHYRIMSLIGSVDRGAEAYRASVRRVRDAAGSLAAPGSA